MLVQALGAVVHITSSGREPSPLLLPGPAIDYHLRKLRQFALTPAFNRKLDISVLPDLSKLKQLNPWSTLGNTLYCFCCYKDLISLLAKCRKSLLNPG